MKHISFFIDRNGSTRLEHREYNIKSPTLKIAVSPKFHRQSDLTREYIEYDNNFETYEYTKTFKYKCRFNNIIMHFFEEI